MKVKLLLISKAGERGSLPNLFEKEAAVCIIGRENCDLQISSASCSKQHAILMQTPENRLSLRDLGSRNGTFVNGTRITETLLEIGDEIKIASVTLTLLEFHPSVSHRSEVSATAKTDSTATGTYDTKSPAPKEVVLKGPERIFDCLPTEKKKQFQGYVDGGKPEPQPGTLNNLLKAKKKQTK